MYGNGLAIAAAVQSQSTSHSTQQEDKQLQKFQTLLKKLEPGLPLKSRTQSVKDIDQLINKMNQKVLKAQHQNLQIQNINVRGSVIGHQQFQNVQSSNNTQGSDKFEFPFCLSIVINKISDLIVNKELKKEQRQDTDSDSKSKLEYLYFLTNKGLELEPAFQSLTFLLIYRLIDHTQFQTQSDILSFVKNLFDYHPKAFSESQLQALIIKISLVGITCFNNQQFDTIYEIVSIFQYLLKNSDLSPKVLSISIMTLCVLCNREPLTTTVWSILKLNIMTQDKRLIFQEILDILQLPISSKYFDQQLPTQRSQQNDPQALSQALKREIMFKCFRDMASLSQQATKSFESFDLQECLSYSRMGSSSNNTKMSIYELICKNQCPLKYYELSIENEIEKAEIMAKLAFSQDKTKAQDMVQGMAEDRAIWINQFEKNIERVQKGAIYFIGKILWSQERIEDVQYPINQILQIFKSLINKQTKWTVISEILVATKSLVSQKQGSLYFEWENILDIVDLLHEYHDTLITKKRIEQVSDIYKVIKSLLILNRFPEHLETKALLIFIKYKNTRSLTDKTLVQLSINQILQKDFMNSFQIIIESCLIKQEFFLMLIQYSEKSADIRSHFLDVVQDFYEDIEDEITLTFLEAIFANNLEQFYLTRKDGAFSTAQIIQIIDILIIMCVKASKQANFRHLVQIIFECINCFELDKQVLSSELNQNNSTIKQNILASKAGATYQEQIRMKPFQQHAMTRLIQLFILKSQSFDYEKGVYIYNQLMSTLRVASNDRRIMICEEMLLKLKINTYGELCWLEMDQPLFVEVKERQEWYGIENVVQEYPRDSSDSQGNSSGASGDNHMEFMMDAHQKEQQNLNNNQLRISVVRLLEERYILQTTLKSLIHCVDDQASSPEIKGLCLKLFKNIICHLSEEDFIGFEQQMDADDHSTNTMKQLERTRSLQSRQSEWHKLVLTILRNLDPLNEPEFAFTILEILAYILGLYDCKVPNLVLTKQIHGQILESLIKAIHQAQIYLAKNQELEFMKDPASLNSIVLSKSLLQFYNAKYLEKNPNQKKASHSKASKSFGGGDGLGGHSASMIEDHVSQKKIIKIIKKIISILGFCFLQNGQTDATKIWVENVSDSILARIQVQDPRQGKDYKLIEYLIDQITVISLNDAILPDIAHHLLIFIGNITQSIQLNQDIFNKFSPLLIDYLLFINTRIAFPFLLSKTELSDLATRIKGSHYKMQKQLKELIVDYKQQEESLYISNLLQSQEYFQIKMQLIINNTIQLLKQTKTSQKSEDLQTALLTLINFKMQIPERDNLGTKNKELKKKEKYLACFVDCISYMAVWQGHSVYDRNCVMSNNNDIEMGKHHFIWNRNLVTVLQKNNEYEIYVRNPTFNYQAQLKVINKLSQTKSGSKNQINVLKSLLQGKQNKVIDEDDSREKESNEFLEKAIADMIYNDNTLMALLEPVALLNYKKKKELLLCVEDNLLKSYLDDLDQIMPKDCFSFGVYYIPRSTNPTTLKTLEDLVIDTSQVSHNHMHFLSMLGGIQQGKSNDNNYELYMKPLMVNYEDHTLIVNEDDYNFSVYFSNVLLDQNFCREKLSYMAGKISIIYNESNIENFRVYDPQRIFLVFSKVSDSHYLMQIQHSRNQIDQKSSAKQTPSILSTPKNQHSQIQNFDSHSLQKQKSEVVPSFLDDSKNAYRKQSTPINPQDSSHKYQTGHLCEKAIVHKDRIGEWVKRVAVMSDIFYRKYRFGNQCVTSNIMQRGMKIKEIKEKKINGARFTSVLR